MLACTRSVAWRRNVSGSEIVRRESRRCTRAVRDLRLASARTTARELLTRRVAAEVAEYNAGLARVRPLVTPTEREAELNGDRRKPHLVDAEQQIAAALKAFACGRVVVIVGDQQVSDLDQALALAPEAEITFLRLVPLVGG